VLTQNDSRYIPSGVYCDKAKIRLIAYHGTMEMKKFSTDDIDRLPRSEVKKIQFQLLKEQLDYVWRKSKFYQRKFRDAGITPDTIRVLKDIEKIPFTTKEELRTYNDDFICVPNRMVADVGATTGTTGAPILLPATKNDVKRLVDTYKRSFRAIGINRDDIVQLAVAFDQLFPIGVTANATLKAIGATVARMGPGNTRRQIEIMKRIKSTVIFCSPDYMLTLAQTAKEMGYDPRKDFCLRLGLYHGHPLFDRNNQPTMLAKKVKEVWGIEGFSCYGSMEMYSGAFECRFHQGYHSHPEWLYLEIIDPPTGKVLQTDEDGELVVTTLMREGIPVIRYRQGDIARIRTGRCRCGKTSTRIQAIVGRANHMVRLKGTVVYPQQIEEILMQEPEIVNYALEAYKDENECDALKIMIGLPKGSGGAVERIKTILKARLRITPEIDVRGAQEIQKRWYCHGSRKPQKFWDLR
jgi:phenylacetate-CoA ligase